MPPTTHAHREARPGRRIDSRHNSLNLVRLVLASSVIGSHAFVLSGLGKEPQLAGRTLGTWAVYGFFCLSGYLIMGSRLRYRIGEYLLHRVARIYPAYLTCTLLTILVLAPIAYVADHGTIQGYLSAHPTTPLSYLWGNAFLEMKAYDISETLGAVPYPGVWNGALWSLRYEFLCYLLLGALGLLAVFRRSRAALGVIFVLSVIAHAKIDTVAAFVQQADIPLLLSLVPLFLGGALIHRFTDVLRVTFAGVAGATVFVVVAVWQAPEWGPQLSAPAIAYLLLSVGAVLPSPAIVRTHDVSYGMYIYAFPLQQLLALAGAQSLGIVAFVVLSVVSTFPLAVASWLIVERPALRRCRASAKHVPASARAKHVPASALVLGHVPPVSLAKAEAT